MKSPLTLFGLMLLGIRAAAAQETTGSIQGRLRSASGDPVVAAQISATSSNLLGIRRAVPAGDGVFTLLALPPGRYALRVVAIGYRPVLMQDVQVQLGRVTGLEVPMERAAVNLSEVTITAPRVTLDPVRTTIGGTLEAADYAALPTDRDYTSLITIFPHINASYHGDPANSAGSTGLENMYFIDGVNVTAPFLASTGTSLPYNFVRSVEVRAGGYEAQYGRALGAIVNAITYSGSNQFEANAFGFMTASALAGAPRAEPSLRETAAYSFDVGARLSGPLVRERLWFSLAYNPRVAHAEREIVGLGTYPDHSRADIFAGKLTWQPLPSANFALSVFGDPAIHHEVGGEAYTPGLRPLDADAWLRRLETGGVSVSLRGSATLGSSVLLEGDLAESRGRDASLPERAQEETELSLVDLVERTVSSGAGFSRVTQATHSGMVRATFTTERHRVVLGGEYDIGRVSWESQGDFILRQADNYDLHREGVHSKVKNRAPALYAQDAWRATDRLTLNAGLRWSSQRIIGTGGEIAQRLGNEWQPRVGFSWQLGARRTQRLFGSYGRFYQQQPLRLSAVFFGDFPQKDWFYASDPRQAGAVPYDSADYSIREAEFAHSVPGARAERFDEFTLGYERLIGQVGQLTVRGIRRHLGTAFQQGFDLSRPPYFFLGTPGQGELAFLPRARRDYTALELALAGGWQRLQYRSSYVLSRTWGNYVGLYGSDLYRADPGLDFGLQMAFQAENSTGLLPNDRTHVFKQTGSYRFSNALTAGWFFTWQSGTPLNEFGIGSFIPVFPSFLVPRGSVGRTPALWDLNLRLGYTATVARTATARILLDLVHLGNPRRAVRIDQQHFNGENRTSPNPDYLRATAFQPPMAARLGIEVTF